MYCKGNLLKVEIFGLLFLGSGHLFLNSAIKIF